MRHALLALAFFSFLPTAHAGVVYVKKAATGANNGTSWADAFSELRDALPTTHPGDEVWVATGKYTPPSAAQSFVVDRVHLLGGFQGTETAVDQSNWSLHPTILSGDINGDDVGYGGLDNCIHVVVVAGAPARVEGFVIESGVALGSGTGRGGGGVIVTAAASGNWVDLFNCTFRWNRARRGAGVYLLGGSVRLGSCLFVSNDSVGTVFDDGGAGVYDEGSLGTQAAGCTFAFNTKSGSGVNMASAFHDGGGSTLRASIFYANTSPSTNTFWPDGVYAYPSEPFPPGIIADPQFVDVTSWNFRLASTSPCRDQGQALAGLTRDLGGNRRGVSYPYLPPYTGNVPDAGAYEFLTDCNGNNVPDYVEASSGAVRDLNHNELPDECEPIGTGICLGDGTGAACPCSNLGTGGRGCENSSTTGGGRIYGIGMAKVSNDTLLLHVDGLGPTAPALFFQGNGLDLVGGSTGVPFGDGLRCVFGQILRLPIKNCVNGQASTGAGVPGDTKISILGAPVTPGTRYYQAWYRDSAPFCTPAFYNMTNAVQITWTP